MNIIWRSRQKGLSVVDYLVSQGISGERLKYKGYGNSSPIGDNITEAGRKLNRRTEAKVIELKNKKMAALLRDGHRHWLIEFRHWE